MPLCLNSNLPCRPTLAPAQPSFGSVPGLWPCPPFLGPVQVPDLKKVVCPKLFGEEDRGAGGRDIGPRENPKTTIPPASSVRPSQPMGKWGRGPYPLSTHVIKGLLYIHVLCKCSSGPDGQVDV